MSVGGIAPNATAPVVTEGATAGAARAEAVAGTPLGQAHAAAQAPVADTFRPSNPDLSIPDLGNIDAPTTGAYQDFAAAKADLQKAKAETPGNGHRRHDIKVAKREVRHARQALDAQTSGAGSAQIKDTFGSAATATGARGVDTAGTVKTGWGRNGNGRAVGHNLPTIDQLHPQGEDGNYGNADMNCAPAALAMIARTHPGAMLNGQPVGALSDAQLISAIGQHADTNKQGTSPNGLIAAAEDMGFQTSAHQGGYNANYIDNVLAQGGSVIANGAYFIDDQLAGHFVTVAARNQDGSYVVNDPLQGRVNWTADELNRFLLANPHNGGVSIGIF